MQQYFVDTPLHVGEDYIFTKEQAHHAKTVVRLDHEKVRLVYQGQAYFAEAYTKDKEFIAHVYEKEFELVLQKATELGVKRIVPFESSRCVVRSKKEKADKLKTRWNAIVQEASEQCKRNCIPEVTDIVPFKQLNQYLSQANYACYENSYGKANFLSECAKDKQSITVVIGCEGGFSNQEVESMGFTSITLGSRILRAETAAMYACSILSEMYEDRK